MKLEKNYFLGLDIGTDSIGFAAADEEYSLIKYKGDPVWGVHLFEGAKLGDERRSFRTARRRLDRKQQRVSLVRDLFANEISKIDPKFYIRLKESALWRDDKEEPYAIFNDIGYTDKEYHNDYPTIHHLIYDLMINDAPHDVRLVFIAVAWLVAHRGHFLNEVSKDNISEVLDINSVYGEFYNYFDSEKPWGDINVEEFGNILKKKTGINVKYKELSMLIFGKNKCEKEITEEFPYSREGIVKLLCGGKYSLNDLFGREFSLDSTSINLNMKDEDMEAVLSELGDDSGLIIALKALYDWTILSDILSDSRYISEAKIKTYETHKKDLATLKRFVKKYIPEKYNEVFRMSDKPLPNYSAYSGNFKSATNKNDCKKVQKEDFSKYIRQLFKNVNVEDVDEKAFSDMMSRLELLTFMPKQVDSDNRVLPYQIYWIELKTILDNASKYLPFLSEKEDGFTTSEKILSVFEFRVPYYVGPLNGKSERSWFIRKEKGKITPWNFNDKIDLDASEQAFINKMTNTCTYLPNCNVLPKCSLLYQSFCVLNEINCISVNGERISVSLKQKIYNQLFKKKKKVTVKAIKDLLQLEGGYSEEDLKKFEGVDKDINATLSSYFAFSKLIESNQLTESDAEKIIERSTYSENKARFALWLDKNYPNLSDADKKYIRALKFKDFGRLSKELLCCLEGADKNTGEMFTIIRLMWETNRNLNEILFDNYTFSEEIESIRQEYYSFNKFTLFDKLESMYVSNAVKRPIIRTFDIVDDVVRSLGKAPSKIFIEMARGANEDQVKKRTKTRQTQLREKYAQIKTEDAREMERKLDAMGELADNRLQSERLYLYYMQMGKCMYSGEPINLDDITTDMYDIDHIYPKSKVKDDSVLQNKVLVLSKLNGEKGNVYPIKGEIRAKMQSFWKYLLDMGMIGDEKYKRLTRATPFTDEEEFGFINRQLVETRQSTKVVATLLKEKYPDTEIVYVKSNLASDFRQEFGLLKSRSVNDLHHAKDAYLNIVTGNVHHECFTKKWFMANKNNLSPQPGTLFGYVRIRDGKTVWGGGKSLDKVKNIIKNNNAIHFTKYQFCRGGGFFDQQPVKAAEGLIPLKKGMPTEKYGGYNKSTASFFVLVKYKVGAKKDIWVMPVELLHSKSFLSDPSFALEYAKDQLSKVLSKPATDISFPLGLRPLKVNTTLKIDGMKCTIAGKASGGKQIILSFVLPLCVGHNNELYIKKLERFTEKKRENPNMVYSPKHDEVTIEQNIALYDLLTQKAKNNPYKKRPANIADTLEKGREEFISKDIAVQANCLLNIISFFGRETGGADLSAAGGASCAGTTKFSAFVSNWIKNYTDIRIIDSSASGLHCKTSQNLLELL